MKRKSIGFLMMTAVLVLLLCLLPNQAEAAIVDSGICGENLTWTLDDAGHLTISGTGEMEDYDWPALPWGKDIKAVTIESGVTGIGDYAFYGCSSLASVTIPGSVTHIGRWAFVECSSLKNITIPTSVTGIGFSAFAWCEGLDSVTIPSSMTFISEFTFHHCSGLKNVTIPDSVTGIGENAFNSCRSLTSIHIPAGVTSIGHGAFQDCTSLERISVDSGNQFYCSDASGVLFNKNKTELLVCPAGRKGEYAIADSVTRIADNAFRGCGSLTSITIPNSVTSIGQSAFNACGSLKSITIPNSVTRLAEFTFAWCNSLKSVTIPNSITSLGSNVFGSCYSLESVTIPDSVTSIGDSAFDGCGNLKNVNIPASVTSLGYRAFAGCRSLTNLPISGSVTSIGDWAFSSCSSLTSVAIPNGVTRIGDYAFAYCTKLTDITIPVSVTGIGNYVFDGNQNLQAIRFKGHVPGFGEWAFSEITATAYYPADNSTWTADVMQDYGGSITWVPYTPGLDNVVINKVIAHKTGNILYWDAVEGADIYQIYRLNGSNWELLKNTRSLGYKDETAKVGVKHYYKIVARNGDAKSDIKTTVSASAIRPDTKLGNVTIYKTIGHSSGNILYWNAVDGAKLYQVYRLNGTTWELLKNTGSLAYKDTTAPKGVASYYKIVARNGDVKSDIRTTTSTRVVRAK